LKINSKLLKIVQSGVHHAVNPNPYRGVFGSDGPQYAKDVQDIIEFGTTGRVAGFIAETIQVVYISLMRYF
jgi:alanine-glyoxylate transaminase/(R)-3-amino-2-methylpropionate-pyruvate transaminase